jgi:outer membrane lipoprotein-sorting protein
MLLLLVTGSCASAPGLRTAGPAFDADELAQKLIGRQADLQRFAAHGDLQFKDDKNDYHLEVMIAFDRPDRFRFQAFDPLGRPALTLTSDKGLISILDYKEKRFYRGPATAANMRRFLPLGLSGREAMHFFSGGALLTEFERVSVDLPGESRNELVLNLYRDNAAWVERIRLDPVTLQVRRIDVGPTVGDTFMRITYADFDDEKIPRRLELRELNRLGHLIVKYKEVKVNTDLPSKVFQLDAPSELVVEPLPH